MGLFSYLKNQFWHDRNVKRKLDEYGMDISFTLDVVRKELLQLRIDQRTDYLREKVMNCKEMGISSEKYCDEEVIVSLTSFGTRVNEVCLAIESIMQGTVKPNRIILWLADDEFKGKKLPVSLTKQQERGLQIEYCKDIRSYKKIVPVMVKYPDACVVTIDDDIMYDYDLLENLLKCHIENPKDVSACRIHQITVNKNCKPKSYMDWKWNVKNCEKTNLNFLTGVGSALYPAHCFIDEFFNEDAFMSLCPFADDVWINAMIWMSGRQISKAYTHSKTGSDYMEIRLDQDVALSKENVGSSCRNDEQIKAVFDKYNLYKYLID